MDLTFDITQRPYDYVGDVIGMLGEYGFNTGEAIFFGPPSSANRHHRDRPSSDRLPHHQFDFFDDSGTIINRNAVGNRAFIRRFGRNALGSFLAALMSGLRKIPVRASIAF